MHFQVQIYFGLQVIGNVYPDLPDHLQVSDLQNLPSGNAKEIVNFHDRFCSDIISKAVEGSIKKTSLQKI